MADLLIYDPKVKKSQISEDLNQKEIEPHNANTLSGSWKFCKSQEEAVINSDALVILTEWDEFKKINWLNLKNKMRSPSWIFDTRNISNFKDAINAGFKVWRIGSKNC